MATITLNRLDKDNAIDRTLAAELLAAFRRVRDEAGRDRCRAWLSHAPEIQAALAAFRQDPDALVRSQRAANIGADQGA